eukprot:scaffold4501_cov320-Pinguiococcus_pyrenoidosus.AAC.2
MIIGRPDVDLGMRPVLEEAVQPLVVQVEGHAGVAVEITVEVCKGVERRPTRMRQVLPAALLR